MLRRGGTSENVTLDEKRRARRSRSSRIPLGELAGTATSADTDARWWLHGCGEREMRGEETESRGKNGGQQGTGVIAGGEFLRGRPGPGSDAQAERRPRLMAI